MKLVKNLLHFRKLVFLTLCSCSSVSSDESAGLDFTKFYLVTNGSEFPTRYTLEKCASDEGLSCYKTLSFVKSERLKLKRMPIEKALSVTLDALKSNCIEARWGKGDSEAICSGAFTAIYYFNSKASDEKIIKVLSGLDLGALEQLLRYRRSWISNGQRKSAWEKFANTTLSESYRDLFLEALNSDSDELTGLALLDGLESP